MFRRPDLPASQDLSPAASPEPRSLQGRTAPEIASPGGDAPLQLYAGPAPEAESNRRGKGPGAPGRPPGETGRGGRRPDPRSGRPVPPGRAHSPHFKGGPRNPERPSG